MKLYANSDRSLWNCVQIQTGAYGTVCKIKAGVCETVGKFRPELMKLCVIQTGANENQTVANGAV